MKFSNDGAKYRITITKDSDKIWVSVYNEGVGIKADELPFVFDRFYKTDLSRGKDKKGTGLGLSIVKEIINAHHENINVISTVDVGTEFIFTLPKSKNMADDD